MPAFPHAGATRTRPMPSTPAARLDAIQSALSVLQRERSRLERIGFELPQARCHAEIRYWSFLEALHLLQADARGSASTGEREWPAPPAR